MKKILLTVALFATVLTGSNGQTIKDPADGVTCSQAVKPTSTEEGVYSVHSWDLASMVSDYTVDEVLLDRAGMTKSGDDSGYRDMQEGQEGAEIIYMKPNTKYKTYIYTSYPRSATHRAIMIDYDQDGTFDDVYTNPDGNATDVYSAIKFIFTTRAGATGKATLRILAVKEAVDGEANPILAGCSDIAVGEAEDYTISFDEPAVWKANRDHAVSEGEVIEIDVLENDQKGGSAPASITVTNPHTPGAIVAVVGTGLDTRISYTPNGLGLDTFEYTLLDADGVTSTTAIITVMVYGKNSDNVIMISDFNNPDLTILGADGTTELTGDNSELSWDNAFQQSFGAPVGTSGFPVLWLGYKKGKLDFDMLEGKAMKINVANHPLNTDLDKWVVNDLHRGIITAKEYSNDDRLKFSASDENNVIGYKMGSFEGATPSGRMFGVMLKQVDDGAIVWLKADASSFENDVLHNIYFDLNDIKVYNTETAGYDATTYKGEYVLHKLIYEADADAAIDGSEVPAKVWSFIIDDVALYPAGTTTLEAVYPSSPLSNDKVELEGVSVYPNPVKEVLNIVASKDAKVTVLNTIGSVVYQGKAEAINTQSWNKGLYFVVVKEGNKSKTVKVIK